MPKPFTTRLQIETSDNDVIYRETYKNIPANILNSIKTLVDAVYEENPCVDHTKESFDYDYVEHYTLREEMQGMILTEVAKQLYLKDIVDIYKLAALFQVKPPTVLAWTKKFLDFPTPKATYHLGKLYSLTEVELWSDLHKKSYTDPTK